ncbi:MAG: TIM barrel protein [Bacillota bacterium]|nr:TIM barrel protein [Bacillota bacterium]
MALSLIILQKGKVIMSVISMQNVSVMSVQYVHYSFDYFLDSMERCALKNIDLWGGSPHYCRLDYGTSSAAFRKINEMRKKIESKGMRIVMYTPETLAYPFSYSSPESAIRDRTIDYFDMAMEDALAFGTDRVFMNSGCGLLDLPREESWARAVETISKICDRANKKGVKIVIEQLQPYESNLLTTCKDMVRMLKEVNSPALKVCVDVVAMEVMGEKLEDFYISVPDKIELIHYADGNPSGHFILGDGNLPLKEYVNILQKNDYKGFIDLEINDSIYWDDPHSSIKRSADYLRTFLPER